MSFGCNADHPICMKKPQGMDMVIASLRSIRGLFHDREEFTADVTRFCNDLRATKPVDPAQPVTVAGEPQ
jgi:hypothetical protein